MLLGHKEFGFVQGDLTEEAIAAGWKGFESLAEAKAYVYSLPVAETEKAATIPSRESGSKWLRGRPRKAEQVVAEEV